MSGSYPFIDIAALDSIREGFVRGDAQLVLAHDLSSVLWVNGPGAKLFGYDRVEELIEEPLDLPVPTRRQIEAFSGDKTGAPSTISVRLGGGLRSELIRLHLSSIKLPDGVSALLITAEMPDSREEAAISGLDDDSTHIALVDAAGRVVATSPRFTSLEISTSTLEDLIIEAADSADRIVKRRIRAGKHSVPGAIARLTDTPPMHLLCIVGDAPFQVARLPEDAEEAAPEQTKAPASHMEEVPATSPESKSFVFDRAASPARFIWKIGPDGTFNEISPELAATVGSNSADVIGRRFTDVANVFGFDADGSIAALLQERDTWSGKRLLWPVEGTDLRVPVELAALPVYSRDREFLGFRGFGIARPTEAEADPEEIGLALAGGIPQNRDHHNKPVEKTDTAEDSDILALSEEVANDDRPAAVLPKPPLDIAPTPGRRDSDKVISLLNACAQEKVAADQARFLKEKERAARPEGGLTKTERNAFREIAERLRKQGLVAESKTRVPAQVGDARPVQTARRSEPSSVQPNEQLVQETVHSDETTLLANLPVPVIIHSGDEIHYVNQALLDLTGYESLDDIRGAGGVDILFNSDSDDSETRQSMVLRHANGSEEPVNAHLNAIAWRDGRALMLSLMPVAAQPTAIESPPSPAKATIAIDDEEKKALEAHVEELKTILDTATDGVVLIDPEGRIRSMNHSAAALFGYERDETEGKFFSMLFAIESQRAAMDYLHSLSDNGVLSVLNDGREVIGREAKGGFIPLFMTIGKLPHTRGYCAVLRDITQWKRTEEELTNARKEAERASNQKTEFLARISHEIRTPLNAIIGFSELMADEKFGPIGNDRYRDYLRDINRSGNHVLALVNDLLDISKIEAGALDMQFEAVSLNDAIGEAIALMQPQANRERVIIRSSFQSNLPDIVADTRSIKQVALNLLSNAVRFTAPGGQVIVSTSYELNGDVVMRVRDTGIGMSKTEVEQALKPFRQINAPERRKAENAKNWRSDGTGLGLPLTKAMVEANRAQFTIDSTPGQGTVVEIVFPPTRVLAD